MYYVLIIKELRDLQAAAVDVRLNRALVEHADSHLGIRRLRAHLVVGVTQALSNRVHANERTCTQEVLTLEGASAHRVLLRPN